MKTVGELYYLLDLERSIGHDRMYFWKTRHGYTTNLEFAGLFSREVAHNIIASDLDESTVMIAQRLVFKILGKDLESHENINP